MIHLKTKQLWLFLATLLPVLVLSLGLGFTYQLWHTAVVDAKQDLQRDFDFRAEEMENQITARLKIYSQLLHSARGLFLASNTVERDEFKAFVDALEIKKFYPGIQGLGFSVVVPSAEKQQHIVSIQKQGFPDYKIYPDGDRDFYTSIIYLEPFDWRNQRAFGYDMRSETTRREAMLLARDNNEAVLSGKVLLVQETNEDKQAGFLIYLPVYRNGADVSTLANRRANLLGWVYSPFRAKDFITGIFPDFIEIDIELYDGDKVSADAALFLSHPHLTENHFPLFEKVKTFVIANHNWTVKIHSYSKFDNKFNLERSYFILGTGISSSVLLSFIVWLLVNGHKRALRLAEEMTAALAKSEERFKTLFDKAPLGIALIDSLTGHIYNANEKYAEIVGLTIAELQNTDWMKITHPDDVQAYLDNIALMNSGKINGFVMEKRYIHANGSIVWINLTVAKLQLKEQNNPCHHCIVEDITERKHIENQLRESKNFFKLLTTISPIGIYQTDAAGHCIFANDKCCELVGLTIEQIQGDGWSNALMPDDRASVCQEWISSVQEQRIFDLEYRFQKANGNVMWVHGLSTPIYDELKMISGYVGAITDITERKQAEEALRVSEMKFRALFEQVGGDGYCMILYPNTPDGIPVILEANDAACKKHGYTREEYIGRPVSDIYDDEGKKLVKKRTALIMKGKPFYVENTHVRKDNTTFVVAANAQRIDIEGQPPFIFSTEYDITERRQAEQQLRTLSVAIEQSPTSVIITDLDANLLYVNPRFTEMTGYTKEEAIGKNPRILHSGLTTEKTYQQMWDNLTQGEIWHGELINKRKNGDIYWEDAHIAPVKNAAGEITSYVGIKIDITEQKRMAADVEMRSWAMENSLNGFDIVSEEGLFIYANTAYLKMWGYDSLDEIVNTSPINHCADPLIAEKIMSQLLLQGEYQLEFTAQRKDGSTFEVLKSNKRLMTSDGKVLFLSYSLNITERKRMEQQLSDNALFTSSILNSLSSHIAVLDTNGIILSVNNAWRKFAEDNGMPEKYNNIGESYLKVCQQSFDSSQIQEAMTVQYGIMAVLEGMRDSFDLEYECSSDTEKRWFMLHVTPFKGSQGGTVVSHENITERKQADTQLRIAATVFESQEGMLIADANEVIIKVNQAFTQITGYSPDEVIGQTPRLLNSGRHDKKFYSEMWQAIQQTGAWQGEVWNRRKNGEIYPEWLTITAVKEGDDHIITHYVATLTDITERKTNEDYIHHLAFYDPLTQLPNRRLLEERLKHGIAVSHRDDIKLAVLMLDLDKFKAVNDNLGHAAGDELLEQVAKRIKDRLREVDMLARLGGDEFVVLIEKVNRYEDITRIADEIIRTLSQPFTLCQSSEVYIGASIGISIHPQHGRSVETLMDNADMALYQAKDNGRGCFAYFSEELTQKARARIALESRLRHAIEQQELQVYFQPQISLKTGEIMGAEALVRWHEPNNGYIMPSEFIPLAEETGLITAIGEWVLRETCIQGRKWLDQGLQPLKLAVNVSPYQFRRCDINALVMQVLAETSFPASCLELELTESGLMENQTQALFILNSIHAQGVHLAIDDFGTGYSSLAYLKYFPLDILKIDKTFIDDIPSSQDDMEIAATIISMAHHLGFKVLAEGVETSEQLAFLQKQNCDYYQGYFYSQALPVNAFEALLAKKDG